MKQATLSAKYVVLATMLTLVGFGQTSGTPKPFTVPENDHAVNPLVASDEGCAKDLVKASRMEGLEQRKFLYDLHFYGCIQRAEGVYTAVIMNVQSFGPEKIPFRKVRLINKADGKTIEGWVPAVEFHLDVLIQRIEQMEKR